jgi:hypothetical protein
LCGGGGGRSLSQVGNIKNKIDLFLSTVKQAMSQIE